MRKIISALATATLLVVMCSTSIAALTRLDVGTYNLRNNRNDDAKQGNGWDVRRDVVAKLLLFHDFDIFGTQECYNDQLEDLKQRMPNYNYIGVARDDGNKEGEYSAIFYRTDKFEVLKSGNFWLSENPEKPGMGWDAVCVRICTWGLFRSKDTGMEFVFFNLHMDHVGKVARVKSAGLVLNKIKQIGKGRPAIVTGDFNTDSKGDAYKTLAAVLTDANSAALKRIGAKHSWHNFCRLPMNKRSTIDFVMVSGNVTPKLAEVPHECPGAMLSDHNPVITTLQLP